MKVKIVNYNHYTEALTGVAQIFKVSIAKARKIMAKPEEHVLDATAGEMLALWRKYGVSVTVVRSGRISARSYAVHAARKAG